MCFWQSFSDLVFVWHVLLEYLELWYSFQPRGKIPKEHQQSQKKWLQKSYILQTKPERRAAANKTAESVPFLVFIVTRSCRLALWPVGSLWTLCVLTCVSAVGWKHSSRSRHKQIHWTEWNVVMLSEMVFICWFFLPLFNSWVVSRVWPRDHLFWKQIQSESKMTLI